MINYNNMLTRLQSRGGVEQQDRMIQDKKESLERAVKYSYQAAKILKLNETDIIPALMNASKVSDEYEEKMLSVSYDYKFTTGDIFEWLNPMDNYGRTYWLIYLQDIAELAYFYASVRKCNYIIKWSDNNKAYQSYVSLKGPDGVSINSFTKSQFTMDIPNYSINLLIPNNQDTSAFFKRYTTFYLTDITGNKINTCWRVESVDNLTLPGVLSVVAKEYYAEKENENSQTQDILNKQEENEDKGIVGDNFIKPKFTYKFVYTGDDIANWEFDHTLPIKYVIDDNIITLEWTAAYSGKFILSCGNKHKTIVVESMF